MVLVLLLGVAAGLFSCTSDENKENEGLTDTEANTETEYDGDVEDTEDSNGGEETGDNGSADVTPDKSEPENKKTAVVENGKAVYSIVYPQGASSETMSAVFNFWNAIYKATGVSLPMLSEADAVCGERYVLFGDTAFTESAQVRELMTAEGDPYSITEKGSYIVVVASSDEALNYAVKHYEADLLKDIDKGTNTLYFMGTAMESAPDFRGFDLSRIDRYSIVYSSAAGLYDAAVLLRAEIEEKTGVSLPMYADNQRVEGHYEILVGKTDRELSEEVYSNAEYIMQYRVFVGGASMQIACGGAFSARKCVERIAETFLAGSETLLGEGSYGTLASVLNPTSVAHVEGTTARIMSLNIMPDRLGKQKYPNVLSVSERAEIFAGMLISYTPDVIGLQETCEVWEAQIPYFLEVLREGYGLDYAFVLGSYNGLNNYCPIIYRQDKYTLDFAKYQPYDYDLKKAMERGYYVRGASQIKLTEKGTSTTFIVVNSHWDHGGGTSTNPTNPQYTQYCADNEAAIVNGYKLQYPDVRIFMTGDFNNHRPHIATVLSEFLVTVNGSISSDLAREAGTLIVKGGYQSNENYLIDEDVPRTEISTQTNNFRDHVIGTNGGFRVLRHDTILVNYCHVLTDHMPVYADIQFC